MNSVTKKLLLVEDEEDHRIVLRNVCTQWNGEPHAVRFDLDMGPPGDVVTGVKDAFQYLRSDARRYDGVIIDLGLTPAATEWLFANAKDLGEPIHWQQLSAGMVDVLRSGKIPSDTLFGGAQLAWLVRNIWPDLRIYIWTQHILDAVPALHQFLCRGKQPLANWSFSKVPELPATRVEIRPSMEMERCAREMLTYIAEDLGAPDCPRHTDVKSEMIIVVTDEEEWGAHWKQALERTRDPEGRMSFSCIPYIIGAEEPVQECAHELGQHLQKCRVVFVDVFLRREDVEEYRRLLTLTPVDLKHESEKEILRLKSAELIRVLDAKYRKRTVESGLNLILVGKEHIHGRLIPFFMRTGVDWMFDEIGELNFFGAEVNSLKCNAIRYLINILA